MIIKLLLQLGTTSLSILKNISLENSTLYNCILLKRTLLDEMDYQSMKIHLKIYKDPATC